MADQQSPAQTPADYDEYGTEPQQDEVAEDEKKPGPDEALTDPA
jgi:hypothetical protein